MTYSIHPEAEVEFTEAIEYYEENEPGLGYDFAVEVYSTIESWDPVFRRNGRNIHCGGHAFAQRTSILATQI